MVNFRQIAEDCLAGKLSGVFILRNGGSWKSNTLSRYSVDGKVIPGYYVLGKGLILDSNGLNMEIKERVQNFVTDMKKEQIKIDIPEGKVPVMESTESGVVITWKEKELTYYDVCNNLQKHSNLIGGCKDNSLSESFRKKMWTLRKLTNIRNYFGKRTTNIGYVIAMEFGEIIVIEIKTPLCFSGDVIFAKKEHAEQAIKILGDELKYLFEPW